jgi:AcrR family transcriptional regulator
VDPRIAKTKLRLQEALFELVSERGIDDVSVGDIADRAGVNRTTFYLHYSDKETLLADALDLVAARSGAHLDEIDPESAEPPLALVEFFAHVDDYAGLYRRIFTEPGYGAALARLRGHAVDAIEHRVALVPGGVPIDAPVTFISAGIAGSILGMIGAWLESEARATPADAARWAWAVVPRPPAATPESPTP